MNTHWRDNLIIVFVCLIIGALAWYFTVIIPHPITYKGVAIGDVGVPYFSLIRWLNREPIYNLQAISSNETVRLQGYPFTGSLIVFPLLLLPLKWIAPIFNGFSASILAYGILRRREFWRFLVFLSFPYISAVHSVQWSPLISAALYIPALLPLAVVKPQLGIVLATTGSWNNRAVLAAAGFMLLSFILYPRWLFDFLSFGYLEVYSGWIPILITLGFVLLLSILRWRSIHGRLLLIMSIIPQRLWYDQFLVMFVPRNAAEQILLVIFSWIAVILSKALGWITYFGDQDHRAAFLVVLFIYIPALIMVLHKKDQEEPSALVKQIDQFTNRIKSKLPSKV